MKYQIQSFVENERSGNPVFVLVLNGRRLFDASSGPLRDIATALLRTLQDGETRRVGIAPNFIEFRVELERQVALWIQGGQLMFDLTMDDMRKLQAALHLQAGRLEEIVQRERVIADGALLARTGAPVGITGNAVLQREILNHARDDRMLRRALPGVHSAFVAGVPSIVGGQLTAVQRAMRMRPAERHALLARLGGEHAGEG